jgi:hypothetical protein
MIRYKPDITGCRMGPDKLRPTNMKNKVLHVCNRIVMITDQRQKVFIDNPDDYGFQDGMPCPTPHKIRHKESGKKFSQRRTMGKTHSPVKKLGC